MWAPPKVICANYSIEGSFYLALACSFLHWVESKKCSVPEKGALISNSKVKNLIFAFTEPTEAAVGDQLPSNQTNAISKRPLDCQHDLHTSPQREVSRWGFFPDKIPEKENVKCPDFLLVKKDLCRACFLHQGWFHISSICLLDQVWSHYLIFRETQRIQYRSHR